MWLREITAAEVTIKQKAECRMQYDQKISRAGTIASGSVFSIAIVILFVLNALVVAGISNTLCNSQLPLGFFAIANIVMLAVCVRSKSSAASKNDRQSSKPDGGDRRL